MNEVVVGLTDYLLTLECAVFAGMLMRTGGGSLEMRLFFAVFFLALALTSLTGGTYHVWFPGSTSLPANALWKTTVVSLGPSRLRHGRRGHASFSPDPQGGG